MKISICRADYTKPEHQQAIPFLLNEYATDPMGGGEALSEYSYSNLVEALGNRQDAFSVLAFVDSQPAGLVNCFEGFSTFACKPLINIHDICVVKQHRGLGLSQAMLKEVEQIANEKGCCKLTLEVLSNNKIAQSAYNKFGFRSYTLAADTGIAEFWQKYL